MIDNNRLIKRKLSPKFIKSFAEYSENKGFGSWQMDYLLDK